MNMVGEMVIERNKIRQTIRTLEAKFQGDETIHSLRDISARIIKLVSELQENILQARMLPIGTVFNGFPRLIRDLAQKFGKNVELITDRPGNRTGPHHPWNRIARPACPSLFCATQVDHGIETRCRNAWPPEKAEKGLSCFPPLPGSRNHIIIIVED
jgi:two-component system chemotaxis sensor kinase CheA